MLSRSAIVKLKAILVIDLIIVGAAAGVFFYFQDQGIITSGALRPAEFTLSDLTISPPEAYVGEAVQISVNITNIGDIEGNQTLDFQVNNVIKNSENITLPGNSSQIVEFTDVEISEGAYLVQVGNLNSTFILKPAPPESSKIILSSMKVDPYEAWIDQPITVTAIAENPSTDTEKLTVKISVDDTVIGSQVIELEAAGSQTVTFIVNATTEGRHQIKMNTLTGSFTIVKTGYHTLTLNRSGGGSTPLPATLDGVVHNTPYTALLPVGEYSVSVPTPFNVGTGVLEFSYWSDGVRSSSRTFTLDKRLILVVTYTLISGYASCPSLYIWNGTGYAYVTDVSNTGWLGYISHINSNGQVVFGGGNPWDFVKLDRNVLATKDGSFDMALFQQWDELFYLDSAYMVVVDHPAGTDVYSTMSSYANQGFNGKIYTINPNSLTLPISATNENGENVLPQISQIDRVFTPGINGVLSPSWDNITLNLLTLDLGDLSSAQQIKLVMNGMVDWGDAGPYYTWIDGFKAAAAQGLVADGTTVYPAPYMEVKDANGKWINVPQGTVMPNPSDFNARTFVVDLTGVFPPGVSDYQLRISNFFNVTFDYIAVDTTPQQSIAVQNITPSSATLRQVWETQSSSSGSFTRYGDVTSLVQDADDMYVIGRQGDQVDLQFSTANLAAPALGMERDYFFFVACWFKDPPGAWGYGFNFTTDPLPFLSMTGFPYQITESYPYDTMHNAYIQQFNTRIVPSP